MKFARLGRTGLDCSKLGFGTWQIGGGRWKGLPNSESVSLLRHAADSGINTFDAAVVYGQYRGESYELRSRALELLGKAFDGTRRKDLLYCIKLGQLDEFSHQAVFEPRQMVAELHQALRALKTDYIDICLVHAPSLAEVRDGRALSVVRTIQAMGAARFVGYSFEAEPEHAMLALTQDVDTIMVQYNLIDQQCSDVFKHAGERGIGILVGGPYKRGYLSGRYETTEDLPLDDDYWSWNLRYSRAKVAAILAHAVQLKNEAGGERQLRLCALKHVLNTGNTASAVVGHRTIAEIDDNVRSIQELEN
jgi:aryl-alcohol dehydrogenase-like predicted oxidoreductase